FIWLLLFFCVFFFVFFLLLILIFLRIFVFLLFLLFFFYFLFINGDCRFLGITTFIIYHRSYCNSIRIWCYISNINGGRINSLLITIYIYFKFSLWTIIRPVNRDGLITFIIICL